MGDKYKKWYPRLRNGASQHLLSPSHAPTTIDRRDAANPDRDPLLAYPVLTIPANVFAPVYLRSLGLTGFGGLTNTGEVVAPVDPDAVFAVRNTLLRLPKVVLVINGCQPDRAVSEPGGDFCDKWTYTVFDDTALHRAIGLAGALSDALAPRGVFVYELFESGANWLMDSVPLGPPDGWLAGDVYCIVVTNDSAYKVGHRYANFYDRVAHGSVCNYDDVYASTGYFTPGHPDLTAVYPGYDVSPLEAWTRRVGRHRNFHGLACAVPWEGENVDVHNPSDEITRLSYRVDLDDADNRATLGADVEALNAAAPDVPGDATWEYADVAADQDYGFFLDKIKAWYGITG